MGLVHRIATVGLGIGGTFCFTGGSYFDDFNDGNANGWSSDQGTWAVQSDVYHGTGQYVNNRVWNVSYLDTFGGTDMSVEADMHSDTGTDDVNKMLVLRYVDPNNFLMVNFRAGSRHDVVSEQVVNGQRSYVVGEFQYNIPEHGQAEWHHCRADLVGTRLVAFFDGLEVLNKDVPAIIVQPGAVGVATFASPGGGDEEVFADNFGTELADFEPPTSVTLSPGFLIGGGLSDLVESDNSYFSARPGFIVNPAQAPISIVVTGNALYSDVKELRFRLEAGVSTPNIKQTLELYNFDTGQYEQMDLRNASLSDTTVQVVVTTNPNRFVRPGANGVKARIQYKPGGIVLTNAWVARLDQVMWTMNAN